MNLVCFLGTTAGGLVCDLFNRKRSFMDSSGVKNIEHSFFNSLTGYLDQTPFDTTKYIILYNKARKLELESEKEIFFGTHTHPSNFPKQCFDQFNKIYVISTVSTKCKFYKFLRFKHVYHYFYPVHDETILHDYSSIGNCIEITFSDLVEGTFVKEYNLDIEYFNMWKEHNSYLYSTPNQKDIEEFESIIKSD